MQYGKARGLGVVLILLTTSFIGFPTKIQSQPAQEVQVLDVRPVSQGPMQRVYIEASDDGTKLLSIRDELRAAGAQRINLFMPGLLVCEVPPVVDVGAMALRYGVSVSLDFEVQEEPYSNDPSSPGWAKSRYNEVRRAISRGEPALYTPSEEHVVHLVPPEDIARVVSGGYLPGKMPAQDDRSIVQNTEFLVGNILVRVILPESRGTVENWTGGDIVIVQSGVVQGLLYFQEQFRHADINFVIEYETYVETGAEPILMPVDDAKLWIHEVMENLGYTGANPGDYLNTVKNYNNDGRIARGTDWVFTLFVVKAANSPSFPAYRDVAISYLGGPCVVVPYPTAGSVGTSVLAQAIRHEVGHLFWALDEDISAGPDCDFFSGYLDYRNFNKTTGFDIFGTPHGCAQGSVPALCIMNKNDVYDFLYSGAPCFYSEGMMGAIDEDPRNNIPDVFDRAPVVEFYGAGVETVITVDSGFRFRARSRAVPNRNRQQATGTRRTYAPPIKDVDFSIDGSPPVKLTPIDGKSDERIEEFEIELPFLLPGTSRLSVTARNIYGTKSAPQTKEIFFLSLDYFRFSFEFRNKGVKMTWSMRGLDFNATYDLHRISRSNGEVLDEILVADIKPSAPKSGSLTPYTYADTTVVPGQPYGYYIDGRFSVMYRGEMTEFQSKSEEYWTTANFPISEGILSLPAPNPFNDETWVSVFVPTGSQSGPFSTGPNAAAQQGDEPAPTLVTIEVFDVAGRRIKQLMNAYEHLPSLTFSWDGTDRNGNKVPSGVYFIRAKSGFLNDVKKVMVLR